MAFLGGMIGLHVAMFGVGLIYLIKGRVKFKDRKMAKGTVVRLGGLIIAAALPLSILVTQVSVPGSESLLARLLVFLTSAGGIIILIIAVIAGMVLIYTAPRSQPES